jgi:signal transduction histidine kinase
VTLVPTNPVVAQNAFANDGFNNGSFPSQVAQGQAVDPGYLARRSRQVESQQLRGNSRVQNEDANVALENTIRPEEDWFARNRTGKPVHGQQVAVSLGSMVPFWLTCSGRADLLIYARQVQIGPKAICQGIVLDWPALRERLEEEARKDDLFPQATIRPVQEEVPEHTERTMTVLPLELDPGPVVEEATVQGWTPLRVGLVLAWTAALVALLAVCLGGWSLLDLSERRIRFVSAVTHELRTPLTTLRLYLDMLAGGMVKEEKQRNEYLQTLNEESDRLNRLVGNVLDFSRLENQRPRLSPSQILLSELLEQVCANWRGRCQSLGKELVIDNVLAPNELLFTDVQMVQQILGNLIDNACKYSRQAEEPRIWLRARRLRPERLALEVEDRGPGVPQRERRSIFRPFRRGQSVDETSGGVGLGLALAQRWARLLGGRLALQSTTAGACFRLELPFPSHSSCTHPADS